ncbi:hypothetical protein [Ktedonobacter racemifer]|uniref:Bacitracin resistance protein BacA n=1 Tax=Ktedonobacter racemifer DSM 44963 TaxID=485913 RepID=D6TSW0_KTERA|nr:hypothetical protein [Ktedonobacter racemifer]EFH83511.1 Bacitracin resistance protein BacA [Ktedonobacter racemifer DSM 44963]
MDILIDGLLMGISFLAGAKQGILLTIALTLELLSLGLATLVALRSNGSTSGKSIMMILGLACLSFLGATVGGTVLAGLTGGVKAPDGPWITSLFFKDITPEAIPFFLVGFASAFLCSLVVIHFFLKLIQKVKLIPFALYRIVLSILIYFIVFG